MPDRDGTLTPEDKAQVLAWLETHEKAPRVCQLCGSTNWILADHVVQPVRYAAFFPLGAASYPQIMLISNPCGHTLFVNAVIIGLYRPTPAASGIPAPPETPHT